MSRVSWARLPLALILILTSCATTDDFVHPSPEARQVFIPARADRQQVVVSEQEFRQAMAWLLREVWPRLHQKAWSGAARRFVPVRGEAFDVQRHAMMTEYGAWCGRRGQPGDCLALLEDGPYLDASDLYRVAFENAVGKHLNGFSEGLSDELRAMVDPRLLPVLLLGVMVTYMASLAIPGAQVFMAAATVVLTAYLGTRVLWELITGWVDMVREVNRARTFSQVQEAGWRYGRTIGVNTVRVLVMVVTAALTEGGAVARLLKLPKLPQASAALAADSGGRLGLQQLAEVHAAGVASSGVTVVLVPAGVAEQVAVVAMAAKGGPENVPSGLTPPVPPARKEPGEWRKARTPPRGRAAKYQEQVTGRSSQEGYVVKDVEFDGYVPKDSTLVHVEDLQGALIDAKGKGYARFFKEDLTPQTWFEKTGATKLVEQAIRQVKAAAGTGTRIRWHVAEEHAANAIKKLLLQSEETAVIDVVHTPMQ
ncbi:MAG TPA: Tox-REase-5 domain-containing protein [Myxococcaceae bacterium]|nr:Tox-REase-5 domain-containing protein [Myxococcaceae bacterium]